MKPAQSNGWMHGTVTSTVSYRGHRNKAHTEWVATLDSGMKVALKDSNDMARGAGCSSSFESWSRSTPRRDSGPTPLDIGSHVMVGTEPAVLDSDTRVPHPIARMWRRARKEEMPASALPTAPFEKKEPLPEPPAQIDVPTVRTTPFSKNSDVARAIQRDLSAAMMTRAMAFVLYDPSLPWATLRSCAL